MLKKFWYRFWNNIKRKRYLITIVFFVLWVSFLDQDSLLKRRKFNQRIEELREDTAYFKQKIRKDSARLHEMKNNPESLERYAREKYYMKAPDEDIFIIRKESP